MNTVTFGNKNSYADFGLILDHKEMGKPEPRTNYIDVPARDGHLDLTEAFGEVKYKERKHIFYFSYIGSDANWAKTLSALNNYINGQKLNIYFEEDYYWVGRCSVGDAQTKKGIREFTIECDCEPYKYKIEETIIETKRKNIFEPLADFDGFDSFYGIFTIKDNVCTFGGTTNSPAKSSALRVTSPAKMAASNYAGFTPLTDNDIDIEAGTYTISFDVGGDITNKIVAVACGQVGTSYSTPDNKTTIYKNVCNRENGHFTYTFTITEKMKFAIICEWQVSELGAEIGLATISNIQIEKGANATYYSPYDTDIKTILNDRKTVTPYVEVTEGAPILSWEDKKTGVKYNGVAISGNGKYLDLKLYEGNNTITVKGGDIRLTYREASL